MPEAMRALSPDAPEQQPGSERKPRSSRRRIPSDMPTDLTLTTHEQPRDEFEDLDWKSLEETAAKVDVERKEREATKENELKAEQAAFREELGKIQARKARQRAEQQTRLRGSMDKMRSKERAKMDTQPAGDDFDHLDFDSAVETAKQAEGARNKQAAEDAVIEDARKELRERVQARKENAKQMPAMPDPEEVEARERSKEISERIQARETKKAVRAAQERLSAPETVEEEVVAIQDKLQDANEREGKIHERINEIKSNRTVMSRIGGWLSKITGGVAETSEQQELRILQNNLDVIHAEQKGFIEDIQLLTYRRGIEQSSGRIRKAAITPDVALDMEQLRKQQREESVYHVQNEEGKMEAVSAVGLSEKEAEEVYGIDDSPTIEVHGEEEIDLPEEETVKPKKAYRKIKPESTKEQTLKAPAGTEQFIEANKKKEKAKEWNVEKTAYVLGKDRARDLWDQVEGLVRKNGEAGMEIMNGSSGVQEHPATLYVFELAKAVKAQQDGDTKAFEEATDRITEWNNALGYSNAYVNSVVARREYTGTRGMKSVVSRRSRSLASERRVLRP